MTKCKHAASGCNYPEGECLGVCMNKSQHTPGPWKAVAFPAYGYGITAADSQQARDSFAVVHFADTSRGRTSERAKADARLISAAPELLDALVKLESAFTDADITSREYRHKARLALIAARAAIAKATNQKGTQ